MSAEEIMSDANSKPAIDLSDVWVQYQLRNAHHHNLKRTLTNSLLRRKDEVEIITAVAGINLTINRGDRIGLTGPNGSGKSTLLAVMAGLLTPTRGTATTNGRVLALLGGPDQGLDPEQTGRENAVSLGVKLGESASAMREQLDDIKEFSGLGGRFEHPVHTYSSGMQVRLRFTAITALKADILLVDEGIGAADAEFNARAEERLRGFYESAGTLVMASHSADLLRQHGTMNFSMKVFADGRVGASSEIT
jgi:lipopolysaccharide transport system ATP-binding protein